MHPFFLFYKTNKSGRRRAFNHIYVAKIQSGAIDISYRDKYHPPTIQHHRLQETKQPIIQIEKDVVIITSEAAVCKNSNTRLFTSTRR